MSFSGCSALHGVNPNFFLKKKKKNGKVKRVLLGYSILYLRMLDRFNSIVISHNHHYIVIFTTILHIDIGRIVIV